MKIAPLVEVIWKYYDAGRPSATNQTLRKADIKQMVLMASADQLKMRFYESRRDVDDDKTDFIAGLLDTKEYELTETDSRGKRIAIYDDEVMRLPKNRDVTNVTMLDSGCAGNISGNLTQVQPAEENFYIDNPDFYYFKFFVQKGNRYETYHIPPCIKKIVVERIYTGDNIDIPLDIAFDISTAVLGVSLKVRGFIPIEDNSQDGNRNQLRNQLEEQAKYK